MPVIPIDRMRDGYDLITVGSGFGSLFLIERARQLRPDLKILILERGRLNTREWQQENHKTSDVEPDSTFDGRNSDKPWVFSIGFGGGTNCWWGVTPRLHPEDFQVRTLYGVGEDWPLRYADVEPYYEQAETFMGIAGPADLARFYGSHNGYAMPPHRMSSADEVLKRAYPDHHFALPSARATRPMGTRGICCSSAMCDRCPTNAKFSWYNGFTHLLEDPNIDVLLEATVTHVTVENQVAKSVRFMAGGAEHTAAAEIIGMGANGIHNPAILMRSGFTDAALGRYLHDKFSFRMEAKLNGIEGLNGGSVSSGMNTLFWRGDHRRESAAVMFQTENQWAFGLRLERGRMNQSMPMTFYVESLPQEGNRVTLNSAGEPEIAHQWPEYTLKGRDRVVDTIASVLSALPVDAIDSYEDIDTANHVQGTCRMGADPASSVVDADLRHHNVRNLLVLGTSVWPMSGVANPSLTAAALSLRAADRLWA